MKGSGRTEAWVVLWNNYSTGLALVGVSLCLLASPGWAGWECHTILYEPDVGFNEMVLGDGRNDGVVRAYLACSDSTVKEFRPGEVYQTISRGSGEMTHIALGLGRNDGVVRVYASCEDGKVYEYTYAEPDWDVAIVGSASSRMRYVTLEVGRNDDSVRVYAYSDTTVFEFTFSDGGWRTDTVGSLHWLWGIAIGPGRNDFINRLYAVNGGKILSEFTYLEGWFQTIIDTTEGGAGAVLAVGPGRDDGTNRVYLGISAWSVAGRVVEYSFKGEAWYKDTLGRPDYVISPICLGPAQGDGKTRIYVITWEWGDLAPPPVVREYSYTTTGWDEELLGAIGGGLDVGSDLEIGMMSNDSIRLYAMTRGQLRYEPTPHGEICEFTYTTGIEENLKPLTQDYILFPNRPNPFHNGTWLVYQIGKPGNISIRVFDCTGRLVRTLINQLKEPGRYQIFWDGRDSQGRRVPNGTYFLCLSVNGQNKTQKAVLIR